MIYRDVARDFGDAFSFEKYESVYSQQIRDAYLAGTKTEAGQYDRETEILTYENGTCSKVLRLWKRIPTFDSGDREYDSWHELILACDGTGNVRGLYTTGGYRIARMIDLGKAESFPEEIKKFL